MKAVACTGFYPPWLYKGGYQEGVEKGGVGVSTPLIFFIFFGGGGMINTPSARLCMEVLIKVA